MKKFLAMLICVFMVGQLAVISVSADEYASLVDANTRSYYTYNSAATYYAPKDAGNVMTDGSDETHCGRGSGHVAAWIDLGGLKHIDKVDCVFNDPWGTGDGLTVYVTKELPTIALASETLDFGTWNRLGSLSSEEVGRHELSFTIDDGERYRYVVCLNPDKYTQEQMTGKIAEIIPYTKTPEDTAPTDFSEMVNIAVGKAAIAYHSGENTSPRMAIDGDDSTYWIAPALSGGLHNYFVIDLGASYPIYGLGILPVAPASARNIDIYGANEVMNEDKVKLYSVGTSITSAAKITQREVIPGYYRYIIFDQPSGQPTMAFKEIEVYSSVSGASIEAESGAVSIMSRGKRVFATNNSSVNDEPSITDKEYVTDETPDLGCNPSGNPSEVFRIMVDLGFSVPLSHIVYQDVATGQPPEGLDYTNDYTANFYVVATNNENFIADDYVILGRVGGRPVLNNQYDTGLWVFPVPKEYQDTPFRYIGLVKPQASKGQNLQRLSAKTLQAYARAENITSLLAAEGTDRKVLSSEASVTENTVSYKAEILNGEKTGNLLGFFTQYDANGNKLQSIVSQTSVALAGAYNSIALSGSVINGLGGTWDAALVERQRISSYLSNLAQGTGRSPYGGTGSSTASYRKTGMTALLSGKANAGVLGIVILKPGASLSDFAAKDVYDFQILTAPDKAKDAWDYSFRYTMPEQVALGSYTIGFLSDTGALENESFTLKVSDVVAMRSAFASVTEDNAASLLNTYADFFGEELMGELNAAQQLNGTVGKSFMIAKDGFTAGLFDEYVTDWNNTNTIAAAAEAALVIDACAKNNKIQDTVELHGAVMPKIFGNSDYNGAEFAQILPAVQKAMAPGTAQEWTAAYNRTIALSLIANGSLAETQKALDDYSAELGIAPETLASGHSSFAIAKKLDSAMNTVLNRYADGMDTEIASIIKELDKPEDNSKTLGHSGGGGGGGGKVATASRDAADIRSEPVSKTQDSVGAEEASFSDLAGYDWAKVHISKLVSRGVLSGKGDGQYDPEGLLTREQSVKMLILCLGLATDQSYNGYEDCSLDAWYYPYITAARANGLVNGISRTKFGLGGLMTREDLAVTIYRALLKYGAVDAEKTASFTDDELISDYARDAVHALGGMGIITGFEDGSFAPKATANRAQAAVIYGRFSEKIDAVKEAETK